MPEYGISPTSRARKLSAIKSFYKFLTVRTKQLEENPVADLEYPKLRKSLPKYLTMEQSAALLKAVSGQNQKRDYAILMIFLNCGIRRSELVGHGRDDGGIGGCGQRTGADGHQHQNSKHSRKNLFHNRVLLSFELILGQFIDLYSL